jgi:hypothetical protein
MKFEPRASKTRRGFPDRKSGLPDLRAKKPISGQPETGAQLVSFDFLNRLIGDSCQ